MKKVILIHFLLLLSACATNKKAPTFSESPMPNVNVNKAILYIYREYAEPTAFSSYLEIDGQKVASLRQEGFTWIYIEPGEYNFVNGWPFSSGMPKLEFKYNLEAGNVYSFEMTSKVKMGFFISTVTTSMNFQEIEEATKRIESCCRYVKPLILNLKSKQTKE